MSIAQQAAQRTLIALISDEDTATGLLLAGIGHISAPTGSLARSGNEGSGNAASGGGGGKDRTNNAANASGGGSTQAEVACRNKNFYIIANPSSKSGGGLGGGGTSNPLSASSANDIDGSTAQSTAELEAAFRVYTQERNDIAILLINQHLANRIRPIVDAYSQAFPALLEIPSKDHPFDPSKDSVLKRVQKLFGE